MTDPPRTEPSADARRAATAMWDHYAAFIQAGFTDAQALALLGAMMAAGVKGAE